MAGREAAGPQVLMLGWLTDLSESITAYLRRADILAKRAHPPCARMPFRTRWHTIDSAPPRLSADEIDSIESVIVIFDGHSVQTRFGGRQSIARSRRLRACANEACALTTTTALTVGALRVLLICDARRLPSSRRPDAIRWTRDLAHRISYECLVNGLSGHSAAYAVIDTDEDVRDVAEAAVPWHAGHRAERQRWPLHPVVSSADVTRARSAPRRTPPS
ncbi:hypothetical protein [Mycobacterium sp. DL440]|uniref:hypothetical protein n=1 Tax=Mycobacterium sp. DL440 TaxID=2675523 RepID=UPI001422CC1A|nr:hypothetical protein [Mycobacterium sp. DL440]